mmetsp:Transcript_35039/g.76665  ORF Transcript_35039/g.76665 Transcript_35039/m.76665 type:complete len:121 (+) Transcript_35039:864-1226(+)
MADPVGTIPSEAGAEAADADLLSCISSLTRSIGATAVLANAPAAAPARASRTDACTNDCRRSRLRLVGVRFTASDISFGWVVDNGGDTGSILVGCAGGNDDDDDEEDTMMRLCSCLHVCV